MGSPQLRMPFAYVLHLPMRVAASDSTRRRQPSHQFCLDTAAAAVLCLNMQVVAGDSGLVPPLSWRNLHDEHLMTAERLQSIELLRQKASAVMHMLASKCGHDAFVSILRGLLQKALKARQQLEEEGKDRVAQDVQPAVQDASDVKPEQGTGKPSADSGTKPRALQTAGFMRQVANVCAPLPLRDCCCCITCFAGTREHSMYQRTACILSNNHAVPCCKHTIRLGVRGHADADKANPLPSRWQH